MKEIELLKRQLERERAARREAEKILEEKSLELYQTNNLLLEVNASLEASVKERTQTIEESERKYRTLVESAGDIIYRVGANGKFTYVNPKAIQVSEFSKDELLEMSYLDLVSPKFRQKLSNYYRFQLKERIKSTYVEFQMVTKSGKELWIGQSVDLDEGGGAIEFIALARDITDRKKVERALLMNEEKYRSIIENMELGLLEVDREGIIIKAYPKFCKLTGFESHELEGRIAGEVLLDDEERRKMKKRNERRKEGEPGVYEVQIRRKDGSKIWVMISGAPYYNLNNQMAGSVGIHLDISDQKRTQKELVEAKDLAEESLRAREAFLATISHEIRTPMNAIIGMSELLATSHDNYTKEQTKYISTIRSSANSLLMLINDLLDFSKIKAGQLSLTPKPAILIDHLRHVIDLLDPKAEQKGLLLQLNTSLTNEIGHVLDPLRLEEILINLIGNAIKFTEKGKITLNVEILKDEDNTSTLHFEVVDSGVGIPDEEIELIFSDFKQSSNTSDLNAGGTGLGLSISQSLVRLMGGDLCVKSTVGVGSTFYFTLELKKTDDIKLAEDNPNAGKVPSLPGFNILVVEDNEINLTLVRTILEKWKCTISSAPNGLVATEKVQEEEFDLVLMDVRMPVMNGLEATRKIRSDGFTRLPIVALTANALETEVRKCRNAGMNDFLSKPFSQDSLYEKILPYYNSNSQETMESLVDLSGLRSMTSGDEAFTRRMIDLFIEEATKYNDQLRSAMKSGDTEQIRKIAHTLKSSIAHVAINRILDDVKEIELELTESECLNKTEKFSENLDLLIDELRTL